MKRKSKDKIQNKEGRKLMEIVEDKGWYILNGTKEGDEEGEFTFIGGKGKTVIDYGITNREGWEKIDKFEVMERIESDHLPLCISLEDVKDKEKNEEKKKREIVSWSEEDKATFQSRLREWDEKEGGSETVQEEWQKLKEGINKALVKKEVTIKKWKLRCRSWWDKECAKGKRNVKKKLEMWKRGKGSHEE